MKVKSGTLGVTTCTKPTSFTPVPFGKNQGKQVLAHSFLLYISCSSSKTTNLPFPENKQDKALHIHFNTTSSVQNKPSTCLSSSQESTPMMDPRPRNGPTSWLERRSERPLMLLYVPGLKPPSLETDHVNRPSQRQISPRRLASLSQDPW
jgi:hypothetical protein